MIEAVCETGATGSVSRIRQRADEAMDDAKRLFRIVIGAFMRADLAASATRDLHEDGLADTQVCVIGAAAVPGDPASDPAESPARHPAVGPAHDRARDPARCTEQRRFAGQMVEVTAPELFDLVWHEATQVSSSDAGKTLAPWMTPGQSKAILDSLQSGALVLLVSASTATEQVRASRIQLNHHPSMVQAYSFMA
jgi:hypothetical protein